MKQTTKNVIEDYRKQIGELKAQVQYLAANGPVDKCSNCLTDQDYQIIKKENDGLNKALEISEVENKSIWKRLKESRKRVKELEDHTENVAFAFKRLNLADIRVNDCGTCNHGGDIIGQCYNPKGSSIRECWEKKEVYHAFDGIDIQKMKNTYLSDICDKMAKEQCRFVEKTCSTCRYSGRSFCLCTKGNRPSPLYGCWAA